MKKGPKIQIDVEGALGAIEEIQEGPTALPEIANRWTPILKKGLSKDVKQALLVKHLPFDNIPMVPPKLNPEIIAAISEPVKKRDYIIAERQKQMGVALAALGQSLQLFLKKGDKIEIIQNINDAAKILCDTIHIDTNSRRSLISAVINKDMKDSLTGEADTYLFGNNLAEQIKITKAVQKSVKDLKNVANKTQFKNNNLNWRAPPRPGVRTATGGKPNLPKQPKEDQKMRRPFRNNKNPRRR